MEPKPIIWIDGVPSYDATDDGIYFVSPWNICAHFWGNNPNRWPSYAEQWKNGLGEWAEKNNAGYYARPKEKFSMYEAAELARTGGYLVMIVEDLS